MAMYTAKVTDLISRGVPRIRFSPSKFGRNWLIATFSVVLTDLWEHSSIDQQRYK